MKKILIGYARCSTDKQDLAAQKLALVKLGVSEKHIYSDYGLTGRNRERPGLDQAIAAVGVHKKVGGNSVQTIFSPTNRNTFLMSFIMSVSYHENLFDQGGSARCQSYGLAPI